MKKTKKKTPNRLFLAMFIASLFFGGIFGIEKTQALDKRGVDQLCGDGAQNPEEQCKIECESGDSVERQSEGGESGHQDTYRVCTLPVIVYPKAQAGSVKDGQFCDRNNPKSGELCKTNCASGVGREEHSTIDGEFIGWICVGDAPSTSTTQTTAEKTKHFDYPLLESFPGFFTEKEVMTDLPSMILAIYKFGIWTVGIAGFFMLVVGGFMYMASAGNTSTASSARKIITDSLLGIVAALGAYLILYVINPELTKLKIDFTTVNVEDKYDPTSGGGSATGVTATGGGNPNATSAGNDKLNTSYGNAIKAAASSTGVDCNLIKAVIFAESGGDPKATSGVGAQGLMQIMPTTASGLGCSGGCDMNDGNTAIRYGAKYLQQLKSSACNGKTSNSVCNVGTIDFVIAAYNAGPRRNEASDNCSRKMTSWQCTVNKKLGQTRNYVKRVKANYEKLKSMPGC